MSTNRTRTPLPQLAGTIAVGVGFVLLTLTVLVAMHVLTGRLLTEDGAQGQPADAVEPRVPSHETAPTRVT